MLRKECRLVLVSRNLKIYGYVGWIDFQKFIV